MDWNFFNLKKKTQYTFICQIILGLKKHLRCVCIYYTAREHRLEVDEKDEEKVK